VVEAMTLFHELAPDSDHWQEMLEQFEATIAAGEKGRVLMKKQKLTNDPVGSA